MTPHNRLTLFSRHFKELKLLKRFMLMYYLSRRVGKPTICICKNKDADQLRGNREADQRLCFRYTDSTMALLYKSKISSFWAFSMTVQAGFCRTWSEPQIVGFLMHRLIFCQIFLDVLMASLSVLKTVIV